MYAGSGTVRMMARPAGYYAGVWLGGVEYLLQSTTASNVGAWVHWALVRSGGTLRVYRNGVLIKSRADLPPGTAASLRGDIGAQGSVYWLKGYIDEVALYTGALSAQTIADHYRLAGY